jgi:hypothetical protein
MPREKNLNELASFTPLDVTTLNSDHEHTYAPKEKIVKDMFQKETSRQSEYQCVNNSK